MHVKELTMAGSLTDHDLWVRRYRERTECEFRLVCFPHAGGAASYYFPFSEALAPRVEVLSIQYPGRQDRRFERAIDHLSELADRAFDALDGWTDRPFAFFGHSMGAIVGFEVARRCQQAGRDGPMRLFASGRGAPTQRLPDLVHLRDDAGLVGELRRTGATDPRLLADSELVAAILPAVRADYRAIETYEYAPGPPLNCPITVLVGDKDPKTPAAAAAAWAAHSRQQLDLHSFPGGHFYLEDHRVEVMDIVRAFFAAASDRFPMEGGFHEV
jgi:pyochelin biosynthesis protein PchC